MATLFDWEQYAHFGIATQFRARRFIGTGTSFGVDRSRTRVHRADERAVLCRRRRVFAIEALSEFMVKLAFALPFEFVGLLVRSPTFLDCSPTFLDCGPKFLDCSPNFLDSSPERVGAQGDPLGAVMRAEGASAKAFPVR